MKLVSLSLLFLSLPGFASDHIDGSVTINDPPADLTDFFAFPTPDPGKAGANKDGSLTVILNTYPIMPRWGHLSEKVDYTFVIRRAAVAGEKGRARFDTNDEVRITCSFDTKGETTNHAMNCKGPNGLQASTAFGAIKEKEPGNDFRVFAGMRSDPFFFEGGLFKALSEKGELNKSSGQNIMENTNVTSMALELDLKKLFPKNTPTMVAVAAGSSAKDGAGKPLPGCIDQVGRPEVTNISMVAHDRPDLRNEHNKDCPFTAPDAQRQKYIKRLISNIDFYDVKIDGKRDCTAEERKQIASLMANDFLVVDVSKPCDKPAFFDIEKAMMEGRPHTSCGGRKPADDIMDDLMTLYGSCLKGKRFSDGVDKPTPETPPTFPFLAEPDLSLKGAVIAQAKAWALKLGRKKDEFFSSPVHHDAPDEEEKTGTTSPAQ